MAPYDPRGTFLRLCLILLLLGHGYLANLKCGNMETSGYTYPVGDITLKYGDSPLNITCNVVDKDKLGMSIRTGPASEYLYFLKNGKRVGSEHIQILNESSIRLFIEQPSKATNDNYICMIRNNKISNNSDKFVCSNAVAVGIEPQSITDFSCLSRNNENLTCTWTGPNNFVETDYYIMYLVGQYRAQRYHFICPDLQERNDETLGLKKYTCMWNMSTTPQYRHSHPFLFFTVKANNTFGLKEFNFTFDHFAHVLPNAPENLTAVSISPDSIQLSWIIPSVMQDFPPGVHHRIMYSHKCDCENCDNSWTLAALITDKSNNTINGKMEYNLTGLPYAHCYYDIRISIRSAVFDPVQPLWSNNATYVERTKSKIPDRPPKTNQGSFEIVNHVSQRDVYVYWQKIRKEEENGQDMVYYIEEAENSSMRAYSKKTYALFKGLIISNSYTFHIWSENSEGRSTDRSVVYIPGHTDRLEQPSNFIKVAHNDELYELSWKHPSTDKLITNYTIFWCEWIKDRPFQCDGKLNWKEVSNMTTSYNQTLSRTNLTYQFAISANTIGSSSGMLWSECTVIPDRNMGKMKNVYVNRVGSDFAELGWKLDCYDSRVGTINGYIIYYCPILSPTQFECKGPNKNVTILGDTSTVGANVTGLKPYTTYRLTVAIILRKGASSQVSDALYNTTSEAAPSPPLNLTAPKVTNNSISLTWQPPIHKNGLIRNYVVHFNGNMTTLKDETEFTLTDLESYKNYIIYVEACTLYCSSKGNVINITTSMYYPGVIDQPKVSYQNGTFVSVEWEKPYPLRGKVDFYEVQYSSQQLTSTNNTQPYKIVTENKFDVKNCDDTFFVSVRAVNVLDSKEMKGEWSKPLQGLCRPPSTSWMYIVFPMIGVILISVVFYGSRKAFYKVKEMKDVKYILPPGIDPSSNQELKNVKLPEPDIDLEDHVLLEKSMKMHTNENSSGCSSGHESISESLQSGTLNSDSGTEQPRSPSPCEEPVTNQSLRQRKMPVAKSGYVLPDAIPQANRNKPPAPGNYCVVSIDPPGHTGGDPAYVPHSDQKQKIPFASNDPTAAPPTLVVANEVKSPKSGYIPHSLQEPPERNSRYLVSGLAPKDGPDLLSSPADEKSPCADIALKAAQLPWQQAGVDLPSLPKPGYLCVGDGPRMKHNVELGNRGYIPHGKFEMKSLKED